MFVRPPKLVCQFLLLWITIAKISSSICDDIEAARAQKVSGKICVYVHTFRGNSSREKYYIQSESLYGCVDVCKMANNNTIILLVMTNYDVTNYDVTHTQMTHFAHHH